MFLLLCFLIQINAIQTGSCGKNCRYQYNETTQKLKILGPGNIEDYQNPRDQPWNKIAKNVKEIEINPNVKIIG